MIPTIPRPLSPVAWALALAVALAACGGGGPDLAGDVCKKADACNSLSGISAAQCKDVINTSLGSMSSAARADAEKGYDACLALMDCTSFGACINTLRGLPSIVRSASVICWVQS